MAMLDLLLQGRLSASLRAGLAALGALSVSFGSQPVAQAQAGEAPKSAADATKASSTKADAETVKAAELVKAAPDSSASDEPAWERQPAVRRSGFTAGIATIASLGMASGYPLDLKKIGRERYYTQTDVAIGGIGAVWIGGALTDWLSVGLGGGGALLGVSDLSGGALVALLRVETFPLWPLGGFWRDVGVTLDGGASFAWFYPSDTEGADVINGGASSYVGGGVFYEGLRFWRVSTGPTVYANYMWSDTIRYGNIGVGWRIALYSAPSTQKVPKVAEAKAARRSGE
jgi:hypothetical protein